MAAIIIALVGWMELEEYQGKDLEVAQVCRDTRYQKLLHLTKKSLQLDCLIQFYVNWIELNEAPKNLLHLSKATITKYRQI